MIAENNLTIILMQQGNSLLQFPSIPGNVACAKNRVDFFPTEDLQSLLQRSRDEAHRFAVTYQRNRRTAGYKRSALDGVPGLGPSKKEGLLKKFRSVKRIREATEAELAEVPGIGPALARRIREGLKEGGGA